MCGKIKSRHNLISPLLPVLVHLIMPPPPMIILTGKRPGREVMDDCCIKGIIINFFPRRFMNENIFFQWIDHFNDIMTSSNKISAMLILDGCASH